MTGKDGYNDNVFINCPFDETFKPLLYAIVYTVYRCGFFPLSALSDDDGTENRLDKIYRIIANCRYGIHDISNTSSNNEGLPRFNMPFELGLFFGAKRFGDKIQNNKKALVFEREKYQYQKYISDINGIDTKAHNNEATTVIRETRDWLKTATRRTTIVGSEIIIAEYLVFKQFLPEVATEAGFNVENILFNDYCEIVEEAINERLALSKLP